MSLANEVLATVLSNRRHVLETNLNCSEFRGLGGQSAKLPRRLRLKILHDRTLANNVDWKAQERLIGASEDGALVADKGKGGHLVTKNSYKNFQINSEF